MCSLITIICVCCFHYSCSFIIFILASELEELGERWVNITIQGVERVGDRRVQQRKGRRGEGKGEGRKGEQRKEREETRFSLLELASL